MFSGVFSFAYCAHLFNLRNYEGIYLCVNEITGRKTGIRKMSEGIKRGSVNTKSRKLGRIGDPGYEPGERYNNSARRLPPPQAFPGLSGEHGTREQREGWRQARRARGG